MNERPQERHIGRGVSPISANASGLDRLSGTIIGCAFNVMNALGPGFLERIYENALAHDLRKAGVRVSQHQPIAVHYDGVVLGDYFADLVVEDTVIIELKAVRALSDMHIAQCIHYLKATGLHLCLLLNFGSSRVDVKRVVHGL